MTEFEKALLNNLRELNFSIGEIKVAIENLACIVAASENNSFQYSSYMEVNDSIPVGASGL